MCLKALHDRHQLHVRRRIVRLCSSFGWLSLQLRLSVILPTLQARSAHTSRFSFSSFYYRERSFFIIYNWWTIEKPVDRCMETVQHRCYYCEIHARCDVIAQHQAQTNSASQWIIYCTSDFGSVLLLFLSHFLKRPRAVSPHVRCKLAAAPLTQSLKAFTRLISWTLPHEVRCPVFPLYSLLHRTKKKVKSCATPGALDAGELSSVLFVVRACSMRSTKKDWFTPPPRPLSRSLSMAGQDGGGGERECGGENGSLCVFSDQ